MATLIVTRGLPGSGKTTRAQRWVAGDPTRRARVNRDALRAMMHQSRFLPAPGEDRDGPGGTEHLVITAQLAAIGALLIAEVDVVCDDTNLAVSAMAGLRGVAGRAGAELVVWDLTGVPVEVCIARDAARERPVGEQVIREMAEQVTSRRLTLHKTKRPRC